MGKKKTNKKIKLSKVSQPTVTLEDKSQKPLPKLNHAQEFTLLKSAHEFFSQFNSFSTAMTGKFKDEDSKKDFLEQWTNSMDAVAIVANSILSKFQESQLEKEKQVIEQEQQPTQN